MSVNFFGNIGTTYSGIVTGAELTRVSEEIFGGAQVKSPEKTSPTTQQQQVQPRQEASQISLYNRNTDINLTQQVAKLNSNYNIQLSPQAMQNIASLQTLAATQQTSVHKLSDGKIYVPVDNSQKSDVLTAFAVPHSTSVMNAFSMDKDRKGSAPFSYTQFSNQNQSGPSTSEGSESVNFFA